MSEKDDDLYLMNIYEARWEFLLYGFGYVARNIQRELLDNVYPLFRNLPRSEDFARKLACCVIEHFDGPEGEYPEKEFVQALFSWINEFDIKYKWVVVPAITALISVEVHMWDLLEFDGQLEQRDGFEDDKALFFFVDEGWNPSLEARNKARTRIKHGFSEYHKWYFESINRLARHRTSATPKKQRASKYGSPDERLELLARYLMGKEKTKDIAEHLRLDRCNIEEIDDVSKIGAGPDEADVAKMIRKQAKQLRMSLPERRGKNRSAPKKNKK